MARSEFTAPQSQNALALYQLMPKYTPSQTINVRISDCTRLPALYVGESLVLRTTAFSPEAAQCVGLIRAW